MIQGRMKEWESVEIKVNSKESEKTSSEGLL